MADGTKIEWTDMTWNVVNGCTVVSPGCKHCYAMKQAHRFPVRQGLTEMTAGGMVWTGEVRFNDKVLLEPLHKKRPRRIFVCAHGDLFHEKVPDEWIDQVFAVMALCPQHQFQVLTKRPQRMANFMLGGPWNGWTSDHSPAIVRAIGRLARDDRSKFVAIGRCHEGPLPNVWLGTSVEDQKRADERIPILLETPAAVRWLSCEPLLGPVDVQPYGIYDGELHWVVAGGESGPGARPMHLAWARSLRDQCAAADVPFLFKQWGNWKPLTNPGGGYWPVDAGHCIRLGEDGRLAEGGYPMQRLSKTDAGRDLDGVVHDGYPA